MTKNKITKTMVWILKAVVLWVIFIGAVSWIIKTGQHYTTTWIQVFFTATPPTTQIPTTEFEKTGHWENE